MPQTIKKMHAKSIPLAKSAMLGQPPKVRLRRQLDQALVQLQLPLSTAICEKLLAFIELLQKWNRVYNLTAIDEPERMLTHHILDSLVVLPWLRGPNVLDVGTGAGLPGIPLSMLRPQWQFVLLDSNAKKIRFVTQAKLELGLANVHPLQCRLEKYPQRQNFATVMARAFAPLPALVAQCAPFCQAQGQLIAMLGIKPEQGQLAKVGLEYEILKVEVPNMHERRHLLRFTKG